MGCIHKGGQIYQLDELFADMILLHDYITIYYITIRKGYETGRVNLFRGNTCYDVGVCLFLTSWNQRALRLNLSRRHWLTGSLQSLSTSYHPDFFSRSFPLIISKHVTF